MYSYPGEAHSLGFTLLEVMISLFILTVGLLGVASLQVLSLRLTDNSLLRTMATLQVEDMVERMRANAAATSLGIDSPYNNPSGAATAHPNCLGLDSNNNMIPDASCTAIQMAQQDFYEWNQGLSNTLANGSGIVCMDSTPEDGTPTNPACDGIPPLFAVKVWWTQRENVNASATQHQFVMSFSL